MPSAFTSFLKMAVSIVVVALLLRWVGVASISIRSLQSDFLYRRSIMQRVAEKVAWEEYGSDAIASGTKVEFSNKTVYVSDIIHFIIRNSLDTDIVIDMTAKKLDNTNIIGVANKVWFKTSEGYPTLAAIDNRYVMPMSNVPAYSTDTDAFLFNLEISSTVSRDVLVYGSRAPTSNPAWKYMADPVFLFDVVFNRQYDLKFNATLLFDGELIPRVNSAEYSAAVVTGVYYSLK